ncbi:MAG: hypothetical protein ABSC26_01140 [Stellaceae bacterium]|jgi:hypothetical protein
MSNCKFCGQPAGFLKHKHSECQQRHDSACDQIVGLVSGAISSPTVSDSLLEQITKIARESFVSDSERSEFLVDGWTKAVDSSLHDGILDEDQEKKLVSLKNKFSLSQGDLDKNGAFTRVAKAAVIRDVLHGVVPKRVSLSQSLPLNLQTGEQIVWAFQDSEYLEDRTHRQYVGGSQGVSVRIAKGLYYRTGSFKGQAIDRTVRERIDTGIVAVTNKNIYFYGPAKSLRVPYSKIVAFQPYNDGVGIVRDAANAKPQIFVTGDGWFTYNLVTNLAQIHA